MKLLRSLSICIAFSLSAAGSAIAELPQVSDARVVQPPPGAKVAAAYFTISNDSAEPLEILDARSNVAAQTEVHLSIVENDIAKMQKQESILIEPGESLEFKHGSYHVMFMGLKEELLAGNTLDVVLVTNAGDIDITIPIVPLDSSASMKHDKGGDMDHKMGHDMHKDGAVDTDAK
jgi:copper(I)-binding protein